MREYKMLPLAKRDDAYVIKPRQKVPFVVPRVPRVFYRILSLTEDGKMATICADVKNLVDGNLSVIDVNVEGLGHNSVHVDDVLSYAAHDSRLENPMIAFRHHQNHQFPKQLLTADEV